MNIPQPEFIKVPFDLSGQTVWGQILSEWEHNPLFMITKDWVSDIGYIYPIIIPAKFITDFASVPRLLWPLLEPDGPLALGSVFHDFGYQFGYLLTPKDPTVAYPQASLDLYNKYPRIFGPLMPVFVGENEGFFNSLFKKVVIETTGATVQAEEAYVALEAFGWIAWNEYRNSKKPAEFNEDLNYPVL